MKKILILVIASACFAACKKSGGSNPTPSSFTMKFTVDGVNNGSYNYDKVRSTPVIRFKFSEPVQSSGIASHFSMSDNTTPVPITAQLQDQDSTVIISPTNPLSGFKKYTLVVSPDLKSAANGNLANPASLQTVSYTHLTLPTILLV